MMALVNGIPQIGLGTWGRTGEDGMRAMLKAMSIGCRHFDSAQTYGSEAPLGAAISASGLKRAELFITTKVTAANLGRARFIDSVRESLAKLRLDAVDLLLIHWPAPHNTPPLAEYLASLAEAKQLGLATRIGVSNFPIALVDKAIAILGPGALATNQVEIHPYLQNRALTAHCAAAGIGMTAYCPIAHGRVTHDPVIIAIAARHGATPAQVALAFLLAEGIICIPASSNPDRMAENFAAQTLKLDDDDLAGIRALDRGERLINPATAPAWDV